VQQQQVVQTPWGVQVTQTTQYRDVGSGFYVRPVLSGDRVTLEISARNDMPAPGSSASIRQQQLNTTVSGRLGEWMVLGDLSRQAEGDANTISTRSLSNTQERRNVLLRVEELP
jgi:type II secretory pathway component GspD/PulD (secretin)